MQMKTIPNTIFLSSQWMKRQICGPTKFCATIQDLPVSLTLTTIIPYSYYHYFSSFFLILPKPKFFKCIHAIKKWMTFKIESIYLYITYFLTLILLISRHNFYVFFLSQYNITLYENLTRIFHNCAVLSQLFQIISNRVNHLWPFSVDVNKLLIGWHSK